MSRKQKREKSTPSLIDIVIINGGRFDMLEKCLDALYKEAQTTPLSIFLMDNASPPEERIQNARLFEYQAEKDEKAGVREFRTKRLQQSQGFPVTNNEMARIGHSPLILFLNDDVELHAGALEKIVRTFDTESIGVVGIKLLFPPSSTSPIRPAGKVQHIGMSLNIRGDASHPLVGWSPDNPKTCISRDVFAVTGACLTIRRQLFNKIGGFNPVYGIGTWEDVELCVMAREFGQRVFVNTDALGISLCRCNTGEKRTWISYPNQSNAVPIPMGAEWKTILERCGFLLDGNDAYISFLLLQSF